MWEVSLKQHMLRTCYGPYRLHAMGIEDIRGHTEGGVKDAERLSGTEFGEQYGDTISSRVFRCRTRLLPVTRRKG